MNKHFFLILLLAFPAYATRVEIKEGQFYVDGAPFYVRGIGYAPWRPHQHPGVSYTGTNHRWTKMDFERIRAAHFNTIRTWSPLEPEDLALARENGLMVIQGIWLDPKQDFSDPHNQETALGQVQSVAQQSKDFDNVLGYLLMTEPSPQAVLETGPEQTLQYFRKLKRAIQAIDPHPVSMDSWLPLAFLDHHDFDFVAVNLFAFWPASISKAMGLAGMTRWYVDRVAGDRPLLVAETGGYAVSQASQTAAGGYGGLTDYDQSLKDIDSLRATLEGHAAGSILVSWIDTWHYPTDSDTHDNEPWEWDGVLGIPTDSPADMNGIPRQIYQDVMVYNQMLSIEPKENHIYPIQQPLPIQIYGSDNVAYVRYSLNDGDWTYLDNAGHGWFRGTFKLPKLARKRQTLALQALGQDETPLVKKSISFLSSVQPEHVTIELKNSSRLEFAATVLGGNNLPIEGRKVSFGCFYPIHFKETGGMDTTNSSGQIVFSCPGVSEAPARYLFVAAGTDSPERRRTSDLRIFKLGR